MRAAFGSGAVRTVRHLRHGSSVAGLWLQSPSGLSEIGQLTVAQGRALLPSLPPESGDGSDVPGPAFRPALPATLSGGQGRSELSSQCLLLDVRGRGFAGWAAGPKNVRGTCHLQRSWTGCRCAGLTSSALENTRGLCGCREKFSHPRALTSSLPPLPPLCWLLAGCEWPCSAGGPA